MKYIIYICMLVKMPLLYAQADKKHIYEGNRQYNQHNYKEADAQYRAALQKNKNSTQGNFNLGDALYQQGNYEDAVKSFNTVLQQAADNKTKAAAYHNLGNAMLKNNKLNESINAYKNALRYSPGDAGTQYNLSYALKKKQQQQQQQQQDKNKQDKEQNKPQDQQNNNKKDNNNENPGEKGNEQQPQQGMSKEEAERILQALGNKEQNLRKRLNDNSKNPAQAYERKPW